MLFTSDVFEDHINLANVKLPDSFSPEEVRNNSASTKWFRNSTGILRYYFSWEIKK